jgi:hypothetical protein
MRRIFFGAGTLVLGLAMLMWATASFTAQHGGGSPAGGGTRAGGGSPAGGGGGAHAGSQAAAGTGSVHYGARAAPAPAAPAVRAGAVRSEHYAGSPSSGAYRNPYRDEYFRQFPPGYSPFVFGGAQYYGYYSLPLGYQEVVLNGIIYYLFNGVYYQPYIYGGQTIYLVVPSP